MINESSFLITNNFNKGLVFTQYEICPWNEYLIENMPLVWNMPLTTYKIDVLSCAMHLKTVGLISTATESCLFTLSMLFTWCFQAWTWETRKREVCQTSNGPQLGRPAPYSLCKWNTTMCRKYTCTFWHGKWAFLKWEREGVKERKRQR